MRRAHETQGEVKSEIDSGGGGKAAAEVFKRRCFMHRRLNFLP